MTFDFSVYSFIYLAAVALSLTAGLFAWNRRRAPGGMWLFGMLMATAAWSLAEMFDFSSLQLPAHIFWGQASYLGATTAPVFFMLFALEYSGRSDIVTPLNAALGFAVPLFGIAAVFTNGWHHLVWTGFASLPDVPHAILYFHGPIYWVPTVYGLACGLFATTLLVGFALRTRDLYRRQSIAIVAAVAVPWVAELVYSISPRLLHGIDPAITLSLAGALVTFTMVRYRLLDLAPVARETLFERMPDGQIVIDAQSRIVDINPSAKDLLEVGPAKRIGDDSADMLVTWPDAITFLGETAGHAARTTLVSPHGRFIALDTQPLVEGDDYAGMLVTLRDVTAFARTEEALQEANSALQLRLSEISSLQEELREQAIRDQLTGLYNRRYLSETIERELGRAAREEYPVGVVMIDIDEFKSVNDRFGHPAGDDALRLLGSRLRAGTRLGDMACRYGGDEFFVLLPNTTLEETRELAERWRLSIATAVANGDSKVPFTISLGVAAFPRDGRTSDEVMAAADSAVYAAKAAGRDRVAVAPSAS